MVECEKEVPESNLLLALVAKGEIELPTIHIVPPAISKLLDVLRMSFPMIYLLSYHPWKIFNMS